MLYERNPFVFAGGVIQLEVPFCRACVELTHRRRRAIRVRIWGTLAAILAVINLGGVWRNTLVAGDGGRAEPIVRWLMIAAVAAGTLFLFRLLPIMAWRKWFFGFRVVDLLMDKSKARVRVDRGSYARALVAIYPQETVQCGDEPRPSMGHAGNGDRKKG